ncbi:MAG: peptide-methionine (S)-S-oxide reductase, partial [Pseudomonadota bacterium]
MGVRAAHGMKFSDVIIGLSIAVIAASIGVVLHFAVGVPIGGAIALALTALVVLTTLQIVTVNARQRMALASQMQDVSDTLGHCLRQVSALTQRLDTLHGDVSERLEQETAQLQAEVSLIEAAVRELAEAFEVDMTAREAAQASAQNSAQNFANMATAQPAPPSSVLPPAPEPPVTVAPAIDVAEAASPVLPEPVAVEPVPAETLEDAVAAATKTAIATFASGCFWCTEADFDKVPGVL